MSSAFAPLPPAPFSESSRSKLPNFLDGPLQHTGHINSWQSFTNTGRFEGWIASSVAAPPDIRAMTGTSFNQHSAKKPIPQNYYASKYSRPAYPAKVTEARQHPNTADGYIFSHASAADQAQLWSTSQENEANQPPKKSFNSGSVIASYLQIPASINDSKGSLAEFAAEITCLFWFESAATLQRAEEAPSLNGSVVKALAPDASPTVGFLKWVTTILTTTQVTQSVILLALLFIRRLKKFNPGVSGKKGSEYRLLTIALMLGNKFLDDNTYTNKTWAEVSGISVSEIHIMEVEFLSNMRYNLYVSEEEWKRWHVKLARFFIYFNQASKVPSPDVARIGLPLTPVSQPIPYKLHSPPSPTRHGAPLSMYQVSLPNPFALAPHLSESPTRRYYEHDHISAGRKRSVDHSADMPGAKRVMSNTASTQVSAVPSPASLSAYTPSSSVCSSTSAQINNNFSPMPKLPNPNVSASSTQATRQHPHLVPLSVPPGRSMSMVYPNTPSNWPQPVTPNGTMPPTSMNLYANTIPALGDLTKSQYGSANASPSTVGYGTVTPSRQLSPSHFLTDRNSPYRPVRGVSTLLIAPPSASLHNHARHIGLDQMQYYPLAKAPSQPKAGLVPYFDLDPWPQAGTLASAAPPPFASHLDSQRFL